MTRFRRLMASRRQVLLVYVTVLVLFAIGSGLSNGFASVANIRSLLTQASFIGIAAAGQSVVVLTGGVDLSIPWVMSSSALLLGTLAQTDGQLAWAIPVVLLYGVAIGVINGVGVGIFGISPIIMTLSVNTILTGLSSRIVDSLSTSVPPTIVNLSSGHWGPFTADVLIWFLLSAAVLVFLAASTTGRRIYAVGSNPRVAQFSGMHVPRTTIAAYVVSSLAAVCAGILVAGYGGQAFGGLGDPYLFSSVAAVAIGGISIYGGEGSYAGAIAGAMIIACLGGILAALSVGPALLNVVYGVVILVAMLLVRFRGDMNWRSRLRWRSPPMSATGPSALAADETTS